MGSRSTPAPNADARRATSRQRPPRRLRLANGSLARISRNARLDLATNRLHGLAMDRMTCVRWPADSTTLFCMMRPSPTRRCARRRWLRDLSRSRLFIQRKGAIHGLTAFHLSTNSSESIHRRRDRRAEPSRVLEDNAEGRLPALWGGARDRRARSVPRQRYSCRDRPVGACLARMGPFRPSAKAVGRRNFLFGPSLSPRTEGEDKS
jgi:hypothetical protein